MEFLLHIVEGIFFVPFIIWIIYFLVFSIGYRIPRKQRFKNTALQHQFLVIFPAYKEDAVIVESIRCR